jgi:hypothetical protein
MYTESTCENGKRLVSFNQMYDLIIVSTVRFDYCEYRVPKSKIHKEQDLYRELNDVH